MPLHCDSGSRHDFPRLAREAGFSFNLYRGRVDWAKIGAVDVDKIVRERDLETLQDVLSCVMSCNLSSDYDLKVLDPNFIKIFQLAQLAADFLLYCRTYLDHCVAVMQDQLRVALQEIEHLRKIKQENADEIGILQRKLRTKSMKSRTTSPHPIFKCPGCEKIFVGEQYLVAHQQRRHPELVPEKVTHNNQSKEVENLQHQVHELQERLRATEDALKQKQSPTIPDVAALQVILQNELQKMKPANPNTSTPPLEILPQTKSVPENGSLSWERHSTVKDLEESSQVDTLDSGQTSIAETFQQLKVKYEKSQASLLIRVDQQNDEIKALREQLLEQHKAHELAMQRKLEELQCQHRADLDDLRLSIIKNSGSGDHFVSSPTSNNNKFQSDTQQSSINTVQAWDKSADRIEATSARNVANSILTLQINNSKDVEPSRNSESLSIASKPERGESTLKEEYVPPSDQDSSIASSQTSSSGPISDQPTRSPSSLEKQSPTGLPPSVKSQVGNVDTGHSNSMYNRSSSSSTGTSSEASSSSYDSDSQSSNSEQNSPGNESDKSKLQLTPQVLDGLKEDLLGLLNRRLRELGVDPEWEGLPAASFHSNMATIKHHENIAAKSHKSYFGIQEAILKEVDKQILDRSKPQLSTSSSSEKIRKKVSRSFSIFARIKSHMKNKLSQSGHSTAHSEHSEKSVAETKPHDVVENMYSNEPSTSHSRPLHEYEVLQGKTTPPGLSHQEKDLSIQEEIEKEAIPLKNQQLPSPSITSTNLTYENSDPKLLPSTSGIKSNVKVYSRSMYANLNKSEIEVEKKESSSSDSSMQRPPKLQTSTPIKSSSQASQNGTKKPTFMSSDVESISELESDLNDIMENTSVKPNTSTISRPHTSLTTAELLANVAKFRQSTSQMNTTQSVVKSNLKSSLSTGNIKKKVVFRDEKDGFDTIELGPAHGSYESITPQRSLSENSLAITSSSPLNSDRPVPQPRNSLAKDTAISSVSKKVDTDSDGDWDWDKDLSDTLKETKETSLGNEGLPRTGVTEGPIRSSNSVEERRWSIGSTDSSKVSDIVKDLERKLQEKRERPLFGINMTRPLSPANIAPRKFSSFSQSDSGSTSTMLKSVASGSLNLNASKLSDLLLDDVSSS